MTRSASIWASCSQTLTCYGISRRMTCRYFDFVLSRRRQASGDRGSFGDPIGAGLPCLAYLSVWLSNGALAHVHVNWLSPTKIRTPIFGGTRPAPSSGMT